MFRPCRNQSDGELRWAQQVQIGVAKENIRFFYPKALTWKVPSKVYASV